MKLPPRMEARPGKKGTSYRFIPRVGRKVHLGRDLQAALAMYALLNQQKPEFDPLSDKAACEIFRRHKKGAAQRRIAFALTVEDVKELMLQQEGRCAVTAMPFKDDKPKGLRIRPWLPSLDRINSRSGYEPGNVRLVCAFVNVALNGFGNEFFAAVLAPLVRAAVDAERLATGSNSHLGIYRGPKTTKPGEGPG